ncbi:uncharacterized protein BDW43DRAFT_312259 [Aspergillus alliaceus]|uniref:uncharacterized protein n=1 Tax=Petromyces alliaceus TaxID=209559 RepID=UPI0012A457DF|nr:uncharacterized protein BDW43DRAFT_312259 [Aspergillus alliaceus]KAB8232263.1 hypothetical protein BDW43DRAFT_312259 [Aspergillus alliaceus]
MTPVQLTLALLLVAIAALVNAASTTWETNPSQATLPGTASNCNKWHTAKKDEDCSTVQRAFGISADDFSRWNLSVSKDCKKNFWADTSYCVGVGPAIPSGTPTPTSTHSSSTTTTPVKTPPSDSVTSTAASSSPPMASATYTINHPITTQSMTEPTLETAWPPTKTQAGQPTSCVGWHEVRIADTCDTIAGRYSAFATIEELLEWNPGLKEDCDHPLLGYFVCVMVKPNGLTLSYPTATTPVTIPTPTPYTPPPPVCPNSTDATVFTPSPTQPGMATGCRVYHHATTGDSCSKIVSKYKYINEKQLQEWNPALGSVCKGLVPNFYYCLYPSTFVPMPPTVTTAPAPTQSGIASNCKAWYQVKDAEICSEIALIFGTFSEGDFKAWNPSVGKGCTKILKDNWYCVAVPSTPSTRTAPVPTFPTSVPRQPNVIKNCTTWWHVSENEDCYDVSRKNSIKVEEFLRWNPDVRSSQNDCKFLPVDHEVCVGIRPKPPIPGCLAIPGNTTTSSYVARALPTKTGWTKTLTTTAIVTQCEGPSSSTCATAMVTTTAIVTLFPLPTAEATHTKFVTSTVTITHDGSSSSRKPPETSTPMVTPPLPHQTSKQGSTLITPSTKGPFCANPDWASTTAESFNHNGDYKDYDEVLDFVYAEDKRAGVYHDCDYYEDNSLLDFVYLGSTYERAGLYYDNSNSMLLFV